MTHAAGLLNEPGLLEDAVRYADLLAEKIDTDDTYDLLGGSAGAIMALQALHAVKPEAGALEIARRCGDHLLSGITRTEYGIGWTKLGITSRPLTGLSHGNSGFALALMNLAQATGDERYRKTAEEALAYERVFYSPEARNWPDLRDFYTKDQAVDPNTRVYMLAWCHGAVGVGMSRVRLSDLMDDPHLKEELEIALATTLEHGFGRNHALCHGDLGNLELINLAAHRLASASLKAQMGEISGSLLDSIRREGPLCGVPLAVETPGLAGMCHMLLRLAEPTLPSILVLDPPGLPND